nr:PREDICTED: protein ERGIC-53-like isoform X2 [Latimeria chalumnae]|eukprot:XP_014342765.1 PREDICTED: protein ERGIC-53-like isoform X2 [Latimeria chalumnae]
MAFSWWLVLNLLLLGFCQGYEVFPVHRRFEYKYSFKGPHITSQHSNIPFWTHHGDALPSMDQVRIVTSLRSQQGSVWTKYSTSFVNWEVEVAFQITGTGRIGADGLAIWFTKERGTIGPVYGAADHWDGVGIFFDTFDNDGNRNNPLILVVGNNGKLTYDHSNDGASQSLGTCLRNFRNSHYPIRARITYYKKTLRVAINPGFSDVADDYDICTEIRDMVIPSAGYFGVSAATGALADDHDVLSFLTFSLTEAGKETTQGQIPKSEKDQFQREYERFQKDLEKRKEEFLKEHPSVSTPSDDFFESDAQREFQMVLDSQNQIQWELSRLSERLELTLEEEKERFDSIESARKAQSTTTVKGGAEQAGSSLELVLKSQRDLAERLQEMRSSVSGIVSKVKGVCQSATSSSVEQRGFIDIKENVLVVKKELKNLVTVQNIRCPSIPVVPPCISTTHFLVFVVLQTIFAMYYLMYRSRKEAQSKKFF